MNAKPSRSDTRPWERWLFVLAALWLVQAALWTVPQFRPGKLGAICWMFGLDFILWGTLAFVVLVWAIIASVVRRPFWSGRRTLGLVWAIALGLSPLAYRTYPSSHDGKPSQVRFRIPLDGPVTVGWGGPSRSVNYHVVAPSQRWAYDLLMSEGGKTFRGAGTKCADYFCYGRDVLAPAAGVVHAVSDGDPDMPIGVLGGGRRPDGNHVVLRVAAGEYLFLCHMQPGSIRVKPGENVVAGQPVGRVGNSGNTSEPHLHIHLQDTENLVLGEGIPLYFYHYRTAGRIVERGIPLGGVMNGRLGNEIVENVPLNGGGL